MLPVYNYLGANLRFLAIPLVLLTLAGCSDPKAVSERNFKNAIQHYLDAAYPRCYVISNFPADKGEWDFTNKNEKLAALEKVGIVTSKEIQVEEKDFLGRPRKVTKVSYDLTTEGKKFFKPNVSHNMRGEPLGGLCAGKATVKSIDQYSEPAEMMGLKVSRVNYQYTVADLPAWTSSPDLQKFVEGLKADLNSQATPLKKTEAVVLTSNGWVHEKLFSR
jgi:hypothetical protein